LGPVGVGDEDRCARTWDRGAGTSSWHDAANWSGDVLPDPAETVCIPDMTPDVTVQLSSGQVDIAGLEVTGSLAVVSNGRLRVLGLATVQAGGALVIGGQDLQGGGLFYTLVNCGFPASIPAAIDARCQSVAASAKETAARTAGIAASSSMTTAR
jgi:hypothetical protein